MCVYGVFAPERVCATLGRMCCLIHNFIKFLLGFYYSKRLFFFSLCGRWWTVMSYSLRKIQVNFLCNFFSFTLPNGRKVQDLTWAPKLFFSWPQEQTHLIGFIFCHRTNWNVERGKWLNLSRIKPITILIDESIGIRRHRCDCNKTSNMTKTTINCKPECGTISYMMCETVAFVNWIKHYRISIRVRFSRCLFIYSFFIHIYFCAPPLPTFCFSFFFLVFIHRLLTCCHLTRLCIALYRLLDFSYIHGEYLACMSHAARV